MLSVLIPVYNYDCVSLVSTIRQQCLLCEIDFEIIVVDDQSSNKKTVLKNSLINTFEHCRFIENITNLGRANNINKLIQLAIFDWNLILDCDVIPCSDSFIKNYISSIKNNTEKVIFGGIQYQKNKTNKTQLRYVYGTKREAITCSARKKNPYQHTLTSNIAIHTDVFKTVSFNSKLEEYGYEDLVFINELRSEKITIAHIDNPCYHVNLETAQVFINKCLKGTENLVFIEQHHLLPANHTKIQKVYALLKKTHLTAVFSWIYTSQKEAIIKHLKSSSPNIRMLDVLKLSYFCHLKANSNA